MSGMISEEEPTFADMKTPEETVSALEALDSSSSSYKEYSVNTKSVSEKDTLCSIDPLPPSTGRYPPPLFSLSFLSFCD